MRQTRESSAALKSQRRFLILMSLALAAYYILKVNVGGEAKYSGFAITVGRPDRVQYCLWILYVWALLRYWQRLNELWDRVRGEVMRNIDAHDWRLALREATRSAVDQGKKGKWTDQHSPDARVVGAAWMNPGLKEQMAETRNANAEAARKLRQQAKKEGRFTITERG